MLTHHLRRGSRHLLISDVEVGPDFIDMSVLRASFPEESLQFKCTWGTVILIGIYFDCHVCIFLPSVQTC